MNNDLFPEQPRQPETGGPAHAPASEIIAISGAASDAPCASGSLMAGPRVQVRKINRARRLPPSIEKPLALTISERLVERRLELGLTQSEVAARVTFRPKSGARAGIPRVLSRNAYCMYEKGNVEPSLAVIAGLATELGVDASWLAFGTHVSPRTRKSTCRCFGETAFRRELEAKLAHLAALR